MRALPLKEDDLLSQWRGYCPPGAGYAIGFDSSILVEVFEREDIVFARCTYDLDEQRLILSDILDKLVEVFHVGLDRGRNPSEVASLMMPGVYFHVARAATFIKHPKFKEEGEWRAVTGLLPAEGLEFRSGVASLIPFRKVSIGREGRLPVLRIRVGPTVNPILSIVAVNLLLDGIPRPLWKSCLLRSHSGPCSADGMP